MTDWNENCQDWTNDEGATVLYHARRSLSHLEQCLIDEVCPQYSTFAEISDRKAASAVAKGRDTLVICSRLVIIYIVRRY